VIDGVTGGFFISMSRERGERGGKSWGKFCF